MSAVVSDTSPLHYPVECEAIEILPALFQEILIPPTVHRELQHQKTPPRVRAWAQSLPAWVKVQAPSILDDSLNVDEGEKEAICLAREVKAVAILMDDRKGRAAAVRCGMRVAARSVCWRRRQGAGWWISRQSSNGCGRPTPGWMRN